MNITLKLNDINNEAIQWIREESKRRGIKMENLIRELIQKGIEIEVGVINPKVCHDLDALAGTWTKDQNEEFLNATSDFRKLDEAIWQ